MCVGGGSHTNKIMQHLMCTIFLTPALITKPVDAVSVSPVDSHRFRQLVHWWRGGVGESEWRGAAGRFLISDTTWVDQRGGEGGSSSN